MTAYRTFTPDDAIAFATAHCDMFSEQSPLHAEEFGDGNLNLVFRVYNDKGRSVIVKQALPYARCVGESWPLTIDRARIEAEVLLTHGKLCPEHTVTVLHYDPALAAILMEDLKGYKILRSALIEGRRYPHLAQHIAHYLADTLFYTSDFVLDGITKKTRVGRFLNPELCLITEDLFFTDPYCNHERNNIHSLIQHQAEQLWDDEELQAEVAILKADFLSKPQALLHGDVHSGSIFINDKNTKLIDAEFGFYGPVGFDVGSMLGNLLLNYCGHFGLTADISQRQQHQQWLLSQLNTLWHTFAQRFGQLMQTETQEPSLKNQPYQKYFLRQVFSDSIGYAGTELIRRTVGLAHVADLDKITDAKKRAASEKLALALGKQLIINRHIITDIEQLQDIINQQQLTAA